LARSVLTFGLGLLVQQTPLSDIMVGGCFR
jgi:hypothetical protein